MTHKPKTKPRMRDDACSDLRKAVRMMYDSASLLEGLHEEAPALFANTQYEVALAWLLSAAYALRQGMKQTAN